ncbi:MAG: FAD-dependent oxidoreductase, partial [Ruminococcus sp.]
SLIPALHRAEFVRYGVMHRNTFLCSPRILNADFSVKEDKTLFFAGQITGVEGYMESAASGILAGINAVRTLKQQPTLVFPADTMMGALSRYIADPSVRKFQPMGANLGILPELENRPRDKRERAAAYAYRALASQERFIKQHMG